MGSITLGAAGAAGRDSTRSTGSIRSATPVEASLRVVSVAKLATVMQQSSTRRRGRSHKVTIADDRGFRIYGSLASSLAEEAYYEWRESVKSVYDYGPECWLDHLKGKRLTFTARVERSREDVEFGFFTRPNKAEFIKD